MGRKEYLSWSGCGVIKPTKGTVTTEGRVASMLELGGGFHPELTGRENIYLNATLLGLRRKEVQQRMNVLLNFRNLENPSTSPSEYIQAECWLS